MANGGICSFEMVGMFGRWNALSLFSTSKVGLNLRIDSREGGFTPAASAGLLSSEADLNIRIDSREGLPPPQFLGPALCLFSHLLLDPFSRDY